MSEQRQGFILGLGSNIDPEHNMAAIVLALMDRFSQISLSRVLHIPPVGMDSDHDFFNAVAFIETRVAARALKNQTNQIETALGRDRTDPHSNVKDRPADIDILSAVSLPADRHLDPARITDEFFLHPVIEELLCFLGRQPLPEIQAGIALETPELRFGETAATIYRDAGTGDIRILQ